MAKKITKRQLQKLAAQIIRENPDRLNPMVKTPSNFSLTGKS